MRLLLRIIDLSLNRFCVNVISENDEDNSGHLRIGVLIVI